MQRVKIYDIKSTSADNARKLISSDNRFFFWNGSKFKSVEKDDYVIVVNRFDKVAMLCQVQEKNVTAKYNGQTKLSSFEFEGVEYDVSDEKGLYNSFICFVILEKQKIHDGWNWSKTLGQSETYDLKKEDLKGNLSDRLDKINDLRKLFISQNVINLLDDTEKFIRTLMN